MLALNKTSDANTECIDVLKHNTYSFWEKIKKNPPKMANKKKIKKKVLRPTYPIFWGMKPETNILFFRPDSDNTSTFLKKQQQLEWIKKCFTIANT